MGRKNDKNDQKDYQERLLQLILDAYERTGTYRGDTELNQKIRIPVEKVFPSYDRDDVSLPELRRFEQAMLELERKTPVRIFYRDRNTKNEFAGFMVPAAEVEPGLYRMAGRTPLREIHAKQIPIYERYKGKEPILDAFADSQISLLRSDKNAWFSPDTAEEVMRTAAFILGNHANILYRELSIALFGDTKYVEKHGILSKALRVLRQFGTYDFSVEDFDSKKEYEDAVLAEYLVYENPSYVNFNGNGEIRFENGTTLLLRAGVPAAVRSDRIGEIEKIVIQDKGLLTIENLTSYNRMQTDLFQLYLGGYHNHARQNFLVRIHEQNPDLRDWLHFGDLDPDGFCILENLRNKTGINFRPYHMDAELLEKYRHFTKKLNDNDRVKAENLIRAGKYTEVLSEMLRGNCKLEQEIISWKGL